MLAHHLDITLREDAVFSERAATVGGHRGLDYIPGSALLGAAAGRLYGQLSADEAWLLFHSGKVRFGNGLPLHGKLPTYPVPLAWHKPKGSKSTDAEKRLQADEVKNFCRVDPASLATQHEQLRHTYLATDGTLHEVEKRHEMRTALSQGQRRAEEGQLFGYVAIPAGNRFRARLEADPDVPEHLLQKLLDVLTAGIFLGRSRAAEYGRSTVTPGRLQPLEHGKVEDRLTLWLLSDLAALTDQGQPTTQPLPQWLGLPAGRLVPESSFIMTRRYSPWNAYRKGYDIERIVITQGSVLTYALDTPFTDAHLRQLHQGLGLYREAGLGQVWANPPLLDGPQPLFAMAMPASDSENLPKTPAPAHPLITWLEQRVQRAKGQQDIRKQGEQFAAKLRKAYDAARNYAGRPAHLPIGPSPSQWGSVLEYVRDKRSEELFDKNNGAVKEAMEGWSDLTLAGDAMKSFAAWFMERAKTDNPRLLQEYAHQGKEVARECHVLKKEKNS